MATDPSGVYEIPAGVRRELDLVHGELLNVHRALLEYERGRYEQVHGRVKEPMEVLTLALENPGFAWLREMSAFIVEIDEVLSRRHRAVAGEGEALLKRARVLLTPVEGAEGFAGKYFKAVQEDNGVMAAHAAWKKNAGA